MHGVRSGMHGVRSGMHQHNSMMIYYCGISDHVVLVRQVSPQNKLFQLVRLMLYMLHFMFWSLMVPLNMMHSMIDTQLACILVTSELLYVMSYVHIVDK